MRLTPEEKELQRRDPELHALDQQVSSKITQLLEFLDRYGLQSDERDRVVGDIMKRVDRRAARLRPVIEDKWAKRPEWGPRGDRELPDRPVLP